ncbi:MAG TPA: hypothetical protein VGR48_10365 [Terriglobales bacterium]|nr:hypothetical protein [Terriglobales bacterium]
MTPANYLLLTLLVVFSIYLLYRVALAARQFLRFGGKMLVTCPETKRPAAVAVDNWRAVRTPLAASQPLQLNACSRWPERSDCAQQCLCQIEDDPEGHRVWTIASHWFEGKACAYCGHPIELGHFEHAPALMDAQKKLLQEWSSLPAEKLQDAFASSQPVCWNCFVTETFIRDHPGRTVVRPWKHSPPWAHN